MNLALLTGRELADTIGTDYDRVMAAARSGDIPSVRIGGRIYFSLERVVKAIRQRQEMAAGREVVPA